MIGIRGTVLKWLSSYILNRSSSVKICNLSTQSRPLHYGVSRDMFSAPSSSQYTSSLYMILLVNFQMSTITFTLIIFIIFILPNSSMVLPDNSQLCKCASTIRSWHLSNNLLHNSSKSSLLNIISNYHYFPLVIIDGLPIITSSSVINLGVTLDANISLNSYIANISKSDNYHLFKIRRIRKNLTHPLTTVFINVLVLSRIDYCSLLLYHLPNTTLPPLNRIIRAYIRTIFSINRFDHSITDSHQLISNWFPQKKTFPPTPSITRS